MDKFPLLWENQTIGEITAKQEGLYTAFRVCGRLPEEGLWCAWLIGTQGRLRLGVLEPVGKQAEIQRRISERTLAPIGQLLHGELYAADEKNTAWERVSSPEQLFRTPWLRQQLRGIRGALVQRDGGRMYLALPYSSKREFPLTAIVCFAAARQIEGRTYIVYGFDEKEWPVF